MAARGSRSHHRHNGDLDDYMRYYKTRYLEERHLARYDPATIEDLPLTA